ncbi:DNA replication terminus site-binding protein [Shewanella aestuarii]|uniref:DNA replication terminus site-binding protein n=1 Tax=Shewanella aestuarii TaxID=1028752 RepID=A0A6G9QQT0_9GAMM|nr:DNA replication terminus site-binding protein [Shewanella aestuarii]QIR16397.1 DNA replication terminus site-binding protein [Shewanella aestuarii]
MALDELANFVCENASLIHMYRLPNLPLGAEDEQPESIEIKNIFDGTDQQSKSFLKQALTQLEINAFEENTYLAKRYPGLVVLPPLLKDAFRKLNDRVTSLREEFYASVKRGFKNRQSVHENLHKILPNLVLLSAVRNIRYVEQDIDELASVNFYWLSKKMVKHVKHESATEIINDGVAKLRNKDCFGLTNEELLIRQKKELELISRVPKSSSIVEIRYARVQPFIDVWGRNESDSRNTKLLGLNASLPVIMFSMPHQIKQLCNYNYKAPKKINLPVLIHRKHWYVK